MSDFLKKAQSITFIVGILGFLKLICNSFNVPFLNNNQINDVANGIAAIATLVGIWATHQWKLSFTPIATITPPTVTSEPPLTSTGVTSQVPEVSPPVETVQTAPTNESGEPPLQP